MVRRKEEGWMRIYTYSENRVCVENKAIIYDEGRFNDIGDFSLIFLLLKTSLCHRVVNILL